MSVGFFKDPRMDTPFEKTWDSTETHCAKVAMSRWDEIKLLKNELDQYRSLGSIDRLRELAKADREGRCVVLPCKDWLELVFGEQEVFYGIDDDYEEEKVREITVRNEERFTWYDGWKTVVFNGTDENGLAWEFSPDEIGKTVFLTHEEAEVALRRGQNG